MKKIINRTVVEGYLYDNSLVEREYSANAKRPGVKYITGTVDIATDEELTNVIPVHFSFVSDPESDEKGYTAKKSRYDALVNIMNGTIKSVMKDGKDSAAKLQISSAIALNEFYSSRNGTPELVSAKRNEGGFIRSQSTLNENEHERGTFDVDMIIIGTSRMEANPERDLPEKMVLKGYIFDFRNAIMPIEFSVLNPGAMNYFENLEPSKNNPVYTHVKGEQISSTIMRKITEESAFGEAKVRMVPSTRKDWVINWAQPEVYDYGAEEVLTNDEVRKALADRELMLADLKSRSENAPSAIPAATPAKTTSKYTIKKSDSAFDF